ncbi:MAG: hypothetical protein OEM82_02485 [Acidobacteriota bacterium]|nr:hypothetical protein [Acidobacteriota bacterium]MDH3530187.1 hypothetical protein [Acidobacteriota bacterium]
MKNKLKIKRTFSFAAAIALAVLAGGSLATTMAQSRDPFRQAPYEKPNTVRTSNGSSGNSGGPSATVKKGPEVVGAPSITARIDYYKRVREQAALSGRPIPKVTSVLLLNEMSVTGIFKTPRGFAAMVEATPIKLSYTIYPGEKFFDGQLVAVEENRLVFRKVTKWSNGKFVASVENMPLRQYSLQQDIQGTAPASESYSDKPQNASNEEKDPSKSNPGMIVSPLEEMTKSVESESEKAESAKKKSRKKKAVSRKRPRS